MTQKFTILILMILLFCHCTVRSQQQPPKPLSSDVAIIATHLDSLYSSYAWHGRFSGTILVARGNDIWYQHSFGYADVLNDRKNNNESVYDVGSVAKQFTAAAIMKLVQDEKISLTDKITEFFPALGPFAIEVSIHHLLSMSSGIWEDFMRTKTYNLDEIVFPGSDPISSLNLIHYFDELTEDFKPGSRFDYSNLNYAILAAIVEQVSGEDLNSFLQNHLWQPAGIQNMASGSYNVNASLLSKGYVGLPSQHLIREEQWHDSWLIGAGAVYAQATELHRWMMALNRYEVLDEMHTQKLFAHHQRSGGGHYGYGWEMGRRHGNTYISHEGGITGYASEIGYYPELDVYVVMLANHTHGLWDISQTVRMMNGLARQTHNILFGQDYVKLPVPIAHQSPQMQQQYNIAGFPYQFTQDHNVLTIEAGANSPSLLDVLYSRNLEEDNRRFRKARKLAEALGKDDFKYIRRNAEVMLKALILSGRMQEMWSEITGDKGKFLSCNFYRLPCDRYPNIYWVRLVYEKKEIGIFLTLNKRGTVKGIQIDQSFSFNGPRTLEATAMNNNSFFIDGFRNGHADIHLVQENETWKVILPAGEVEMEGLN